MKRRFAAVACRTTGFSAMSTRASSTRPVASEPAYTAHTPAARIPSAGRWSRRRGGALIARFPYSTPRLPVERRGPHLVGERRSPRGGASSHPAATFHVPGDVARHAHCVPLAKRMRARSYVLLVALLLAPPAGAVRY